MVYVSASGITITIVRISYTVTYSIRDNQHSLQVFVNILFISRDFQLFPIFCSFSLLIIYIVNCDGIGSREYTIGD